MTDREALQLAVNALNDITPNEYRKRVRELLRYIEQDTGVKPE